MDLKQSFKAAVGRQMEKRKIENYHQSTFSLSLVVTNEFYAKISMSTV